ncbi:MAG: DUF4922 domain-containing protein [Clostridiaceae bacterium]
MREALDHLVLYFLEKGYLHEDNLDYARNRAFRILEVQGWTLDRNITSLNTPSMDLDVIIEYALKNGLIKNQGATFIDDFIGELTDCLIDSPVEVTRNFENVKQSTGIKQATDFFYKFCKDIDYIKLKRTKKNLNWKHPSRYGDLQITVNLSKPEKTPEEIKLAALSKSDYPKCALCVENVGLGGITHPPRQHHRIIRMLLAKDDYYFQYSPYAYFNEHCIVLSKVHRPMKIDSHTIDVMMDFVCQVPHYFIAGNADLPIVGGSILSHDHFQGGNTIFPVETTDFESVVKSDKGETGILNWPVSTIKITGDKEYVKTHANKLLEAWIKYNNQNLKIISHTGETRHNTVNLFFRYSKTLNEYTCIMLLRNNRTDSEHPDGIFHTRGLFQVIKKENIGIIEALGLAILPPRMKKEMEEFTELPQFKDWLSSFPEEEQEKGPEYLIGETFRMLLEDVGVFKKTESGLHAFRAFIKESTNDRA